MSSPPGRKGNNVRVADIRPFRGVHYNEAVIKDWSTVICPPYDIISPDQQEEYYHLNKHNFIRLEYSRELPQDTPTDNRYTRATFTLEQWLEEGTLVTDDKPSIYLHDHYFTFRGKQYNRRSMLARVRLEEWEKMVVRPHEGTLREAKGDRLNLLRSLRINTSPILTMYEDPGRQIAPMLSAQERNRPLVSISGVNGEGHNLWAIDDPETVGTICGLLADRPLYIADGHHRYESALAYRNEQRTFFESSDGEESFNFVMVSMVDFTDPGLLILAPHRVVRGIPKSTLDDFTNNLKSFFHMETLPADTPDVLERIDTLLAAESDITAVLYGPDTENLLVLKLNDPDAAAQMMPYFHSELYRRLDVSIIDHVILENLLALSTEKEKESLAYSYDIGDAMDRVASQEYQLTLLLRPIAPELIKTVSDAGDKMPRKSTYFYPKSPSGLVINRLV